MFDDLRFYISKIPEGVRNVIERAAKTFVQSFGVVFLLPLDVLDLSAWETTLTAAAAAGFSAVWNLVQGWASN